MASLVIDLTNDAAQWMALMPDGATASTELSIADDPGAVRFAPHGTSVRIDATTVALGHILLRTIPLVDLRDYEELRLSVRSDRTADGDRTEPFFLELRLGSDEMGISDPVNAWHRYIPIEQASQWDTVRLGIDDLHMRVRTTVRHVQLRCIDATRPFRIHIDDVLAVRDEMLLDVDAALLSRLNGRLTLDGEPVPVQIQYSRNPTSLVVPSIQIEQIDLRFAEDRAGSTELRRDFSAFGYRLRSTGSACDLLYAIQAVGQTREEQARILEFLLSALPAGSQLPVAGLPVSVELAMPHASRPRSAGSVSTGDPLVLYYLVKTRLERGPVRTVRPVMETLVETDAMVR